MTLSEWEAKAWLGVLFGIVLGCVATVWMAVENEIDHYYRPSRLEIGPVEPAHPRLQLRARDNPDDPLEIGKDETTPWR